MTKINSLAAATLTTLLAACGSNTNSLATPATPPPDSSPNILLPTNSKLLALGDSYTIGEHANPADRWPNQLAAALQSRKINLGPASIIARTGWTTADLLDAIARAHPAGPYELVLLQIGVNNQFHGRPLNECQSQFQHLLTTAIALAHNDRHRVVVLSIPDYGITPFGKSAGATSASREVDAFNAMEKQLCDQQKIAYVDITPESRDAEHDPSLLASDGLHPSAIMYKAWVQQMLPTAEAALTPATAEQTTPQ